MADVRTLDDIDALCREAREYFRGHSSEKQKEVDGVFTLCFDVFRSVRRFKNPDEWKGSREEWTLALLVQSIETVLAMYYLSESGFWDNALVLKRNFAELLLAAIAIGYDEQCFIDWKNERENVDSFGKLLKRVTQSSGVPELEKSLLPHLNRYWTQSSQLFSHNIRPRSIRTLVKDGQIKFEPKTAATEFQKKRINTIRNMLLDVISVTLGVFKYDDVVGERVADFPEAPEIIERCNLYFNNQSWRNEDTA